MLEQIAAHKRQELSQRQQQLPLEQLLQRPEISAPRRGFIQQLRQCQQQLGYGLIAELKRASPSKGEIRADFDVASLAQNYAAGGASCLSVLTDQRYFRGHDGYLQIARACTGLPVLRKDFIIDSYQIYESKLIGADCILLIAALLSDGKLQQYTQLAAELQLDILFEVHDAAELERVSKLTLDPERHLLGINNRNLKNFRTNLQTSIELSVQAQKTDLLLVSESGINSHADILQLQQCGIQCYLIGEALMRFAEPAQGIKAILLK